MAMRAMRDVEIENLLTGLRLLRSYMTEEQLQTPVLQFFKENLPNLAIVKNEENGQIEMQWKDSDNADGKDTYASLLHRMSIAYPYCSAAPSFGGYELSTKSGIANGSLYCSYCDVWKLRVSLLLHFL